jgi:hypothetical protein
MERIKIMDNSNLPSNEEVGFLFVCPFCASDNYAIDGSANYICLVCRKEIEVKFDFGDNGCREITAMIYGADAMQPSKRATLFLEAVKNQRAKIAEYELNKTALLDALLTDEQRQEIARIKAETEDAMRPHHLILDSLEPEVVKDVLSLKSSVKVPGLIAVYTPERVSYDAKKLEGYAAAHPEVRELATSVNATVSIKKGK